MKPKRRKGMLWQSSQEKLLQALLPEFFVPVDQYVVDRIVLDRIVVHGKDDSVKELVRIHNGGPPRDLPAHTWKTLERLVKMPRSFAVRRRENRVRSKKWRKKCKRKSK